MLIFAFVVAAFGLLILLAMLYDQSDRTDKWRERAFDALKTCETWRTACQAQREATEATFALSETMRNTIKEQDKLIKRLVEERGGSYTTTPKPAMKN